MRKAHQRCDRTRHGVIALNAARRAQNVGAHSPKDEQVNGWIDRINTAKNQGREACALLSLYGPNHLVVEARKVLEAEDAVYRHLEDGDDGPLDLTGPPPRLAEASGALDMATQKFAEVARKFIR